MSEPNANPDLYDTDDDEELAMERDHAEVDNLSRVFHGLQPRYAVIRNNSETFVRRETLSVAERRELIGTFWQYFQSSYLHTLALYEESQALFSDHFPARDLVAEAQAALARMAQAWANRARRS